MLVKDLVAEFLEYHQRRSSSDETVKTYRKGLAWLSRGFGDADWDSLDRLALVDALEASCRKPDGSRYSDATERRNKVAFDLLQKRIVDEREISERRALKPKDLKLPGSGRRDCLPTPQELDRLIAAASPALRLVLRAFRASGMRPNEVCRADIEAIECRGAKRTLVMTEHKTARKIGARRIALGGQLRIVVDEAIAGRETGPVWIDDRSKRWTERRIRDRFRTLKIRLGLPADLVPYSVRHYVGTRVTKRAGIHAAKELLGHRSISMTQRYAHGDDDDQLDAQAALERAERGDPEPPKEPLAAAA